MDICSVVFSCCNVLPLSVLAEATAMANKGPAYGLSREVQSKIDKKYDPELEERLVAWIMAQCGSEVGSPEAGKTGFQNWLKDGCVSFSLLRLNTLWSVCMHVCV